MSDSAFTTRDAELRRRVDELNAALLALIPVESASATPSDAEVRRIRELAMYVVTARTVLYAAPLGTSQRGSNGCGNTVLHERSTADGEQRMPSPLFAFARSLGKSDNHGAVELAVGALTEIAGGFRCLNNEELSVLDAAFTEAVLSTAQDLRSSARPLASKWVLDSALPVSLLMFDAVQYTTVPPAYRLLTDHVGASIEPGEMPSEDGASPSADVDAGCESFLCQTYGRDARRLGLSLDRLGVWLPDPLASGRLRRSGAAPWDLIRSLVDLRNLGEGDCSLFEMAQGGFRCPSARTCQSARLAEDPLGGAGLLAGLGISAVPGALGSPLTHLLTPRGAGLSAHNGCGGGSPGSSSPGGAFSDCLGPPLPSRAGRFSPDPELDRVLRCSLEATSTPVDVSLEPAASCRVSQDSAADLADPTVDPRRPTAEELANLYPSLRAQVADLLRNGTRITVGDFSYTRDQMAAGIQTAFSSAPRLTTENIIAVLSTDVAASVEGARSTSLPGDTLGDASVRGSHAIRIDLAEHLAMDNPVTEVVRTLLHEAVHAFLDEAASRGWTASYSDAYHHRITGGMGLRGHLCANPEDCTSSCSIDDSRVARFESCVEAEAPIDAENIRCESAEDLCGGRDQGALSYPLVESCTQTPPLAPEPDCLVANCGDDASALASACCGGGTVEPGMVRVFERAIGPGPMPPRPEFAALAPLDALPDDLPVSPP